MRNSKFLQLLILLFTTIIVFSTSSCSSDSSSSSSSYSSSSFCAEGVIIIEEQREAPARLSVREAKCEEHSSAVKLTLTDISNKPVTGYEIREVEDYENKKAIESAQSTSGSSVVLKSGESQEIFSSGGFTGGTGSGKPIGKLQRKIFSISRIDFADGSSWSKQ